MRCCRINTKTKRHKRKCFIADCHRKFWARSTLLGVRQQRNTTYMPMTSIIITIYAYARAFTHMSSGTSNRKHSRMEMSINEMAKKMKWNVYRQRYDTSVILNSKYFPCVHNILHLLFQHVEHLPWHSLQHPHRMIIIMKKKNSKIEGAARTDER